MEFDGFKTQKCVRVSDRQICPKCDHQRRYHDYLGICSDCRANEECGMRIIQIGPK